MTGIQLSDLPRINELDDLSGSELLYLIDGQGQSRAVRLSDIGYLSLGRKCKFCGEASVPGISCRGCGHIR